MLSRGSSVVERRFRKPKVVGSIPTPGSTGMLSQIALVLFEPFHPARGTHLSYRVAGFHSSFNLLIHCSPHLQVATTTAPF
jgi:hypothetical protein